MYSEKETGPFAFNLGLSHLTLQPREKDPRTLMVSKRIFSTFVTGRVSLVRLAPMVEPCVARFLRNCSPS